jgi:hypothetical protein
MTTYGWPDYATVRKARFYVRALSRGYESPLTRQGLYERLAGEQWTAQIECAPMPRATASRMRAWLSKIDGMAGTIAVPEFTYIGPSGAISNVLADGTLDRVINPAVLYGFSDSTTFDDSTKFADIPASATIGASAAPLDESVVLSGLPASLAGALAEGDVIQVGQEFGDASQMFQIITGGATDATGSIRVGVRPRVRNSFPVGTPVYLTTPKCLMRLASDDESAMDFDVDQVTLAVKLTEAI